MRAVRQPKAVGGAVPVAEEQLGGRGDAASADEVREVVEVLGVGAERPRLRPARKAATSRAAGD